MTPVDDAAGQKQVRPQITVEMDLQRKRRNNAVPAGQLQYRSDMPERAEILCREHGFTLKQLGAAFGVTKEAIRLWCHKYPEFKEAVQRGRDDFDSELVEKSLCRQALGFSHVERTMEPRRDDETGETAMVLVREVVKEALPSVTATIFWLKNRKTARWRDKQEVEIEGVSDLARAMMEARKRLSGTSNGSNGD